MIRARHGVLAALLTLCARPPTAHAQDSPTLDSTAGLVLAPRSRQFASVHDAAPLDGSQVAGRLSYLHRPLVVGLESSSTDDLSSAVVAGTFVWEFSWAEPLPLGLDAGIAGGFHGGQWGNGASAITGDPRGLPAFGFRDLRFELGWGKTFGPYALRPYVGLFAPVGSRAAMSAETRARLELGLSMNAETGRFAWGLEVHSSLRQQQDLGQVVWGSQLAVALAASVRISRQTRAGIEMFAAPVLSRAETTNLPAEALLSVSTERKRWHYKLAGGAGLPLTRVTGLATEPSWVRGTASPTLRLSLECTLLLNPEKRDAPRSRETSTPR